MKKPLIAITGGFMPPSKTTYNFEVYYNFKANSDAIQAAGGIPVLLPYYYDEAMVRELLTRVDGLFISGGEDIDPARYGEERKDYTEPSTPARDDMDLLLIKIALEMDKPMLNICRGSQALNVALGGTLYQDIKIEKGTNHAIFDTLGATTAHDVSLDKDSRMYKLIGKDKLAINSLHHQGIKDLAPGLKAVGVADDGMVEITEVVGKRYVTGIQGHPEFDLANPEYLAIYKNFVDSCR